MNLTFIQRLQLEWIWFRRLPWFIWKWIKWRNEFMKNMHIEMKIEDRTLPYQCPRCLATGPITSQSDSTKDRYGCANCLIHFRKDGTIVSDEGRRN